MLIKNIGIGHSCHSFTTFSVEVIFSAVLECFNHCVVYVICEFVKAIWVNLKF